MIENVLRGKLYKMSDLLIFFFSGILVPQGMAALVPLNNNFPSLLCEIGKSSKEQQAYLNTCLFFFQDPSLLSHMYLSSNICLFIYLVFYLFLLKIGLI